MTDRALSAYARLGSQEYLEVFGLDFEHFKVGQVFRHWPGVTISQQDIADEALDTFNAAQLHYDANYAANTEFKRPLGVSTLTLQKCLGMAWKTFARKDRIVSIAAINMPNPLYAETTLYSESEILAVHYEDGPCGRVTVRSKAVDNNRIEYLVVEYTVAIYICGEYPVYRDIDAEFNLEDKRFNAYLEDEDGALVEQTGLYFDDFRVGETFHHRPEKFTAATEASEHARRSMDWNPRFNNSAFAKEHFSDASSPLTESYTIGATTASTTRTFGRVVANLAWKNVQMRRLVYPGEVFASQSQIIDKRDSRSRPDQGILTVNTVAKDRTGDTLLSYERVLMVYRKDSGPYARTDS